MTEHDHPLGEGDVIDTPEGTATVVAVEPCFWDPDRHDYHVELADGEQMKLCQDDL